MRIFNLSCYDGHKSFYGKAQVIKKQEGRYLQSYNTIVCFLSYGGTFTRLWKGYSATTMRHINSFMQFVGLSQYSGKKWWDSLEVDKPINFAKNVPCQDTKYNVKIQVSQNDTK